MTQTFSLKIALAAALGAMCLTGAAHAATSTSAISVSAFVVDTCSMEVRAPAGGSVGVSATCQRGSDYTIGATSGVGRGALTASGANGAIVSYSRANGGTSTAKAAAGDDTLVLTVTY